MAGTAVRRRLSWQLATVAAVTQETESVRTIALDLPDWPGHRAGQHLDVRLTADDGYTAERSYSIASADGEPAAITVGRLEHGEVSPYLTQELRPGDQMEVRGPIGNWFTWGPDDGGPLLLIAGGSGVVPLRAILRHRQRSGSSVPARLLYSSRSLADVICREELDHYAGSAQVRCTLTRDQPPGWGGFSGRVDDAMLARVAWRASQLPLAFICGDPFWGDAVALFAFTHGLADNQYRPESFTGTPGNLLAGRNVTAIALQIPDVAFGGADVARWARISLHGHAPQRQVSRAAHPLVRSFFFPHPGADTERLNASSPADDVAQYTDVVRRTAAHVAALSRAADPDEHAATLVAAFLPDQLRYRPGQPAHFAPGTGNGRDLHDDAFGTTLSLPVGHPLGVTTSPHLVVP